MTEENAAAGALLGAVAGVGGVVGAAVGALHAAEGTLDKMFGAAQVSSQKFTVNRDTVLQAGKIIGDESLKLHDALGDAVDKLRVHVNDSVNRQIASAWNERLVDGTESYARRVQQYIDSLDKLVEQLREAAKQYGFTEEEVGASFGTKGVQ